MELREAGAKAPAFLFEITFQSREATERRFYRAIFERLGHHLKSSFTVMYEACFRKKAQLNAIGKAEVMDVW